MMTQRFEHDDFLEFHNELCENGNSENVLSIIEKYVDVAFAPKFCYYYLTTFCDYKDYRFEKIIHTCPEWSFEYARSLCTVYKTEYGQSFVFDRMYALSSGLEAAIKKSPSTTLSYVLSIIKKRDDELEDVIKKSLYSSWYYATHFLANRDESFEAVIKQDNYYWNKYKELFNIKSDSTKKCKLFSWMGINVNKS